MVPPTPSPGTVYFQAKFPGHTPCPMEFDELQIQAWYVDHLEGTPAAISFWVGADGENGELFERLPIGTWSVTFSAAQCEELYNENMYIVLETDLYPEGELRGDILMAKSAPVEAHSWGAIKHRYH